MCRKKSVLFLWGLENVTDSLPKFMLSQPLAGPFLGAAILYLATQEQAAGYSAKTLKAQVKTRRFPVGLFCCGPKRGHLVRKRLVVKEIISSFKAGLASL